MNNLMNYKGYLGTVEYSEADEILFGRVIGIKSLISYEGDTLQGLRQDFYGALDDYLSLCEAKGIKPETPYKGSFNVRIPSELHKKLAIYSTTHEKTLNSCVKEALENYVAK